ncbi:glycosyltransferase family 4 protein [Geodermatophilus sabuli]|uniref:Glycosyltransferase involved in cell wall bisynthesis n=1 Tax=Geodermatophilus sabuli TaxID=1564158 RepID=A0A285ECF7_9ACTN|nr:glycosyltransferase family 4 protein [Geodermatophilus sabuli]MBB3083602.1 glycosyltransferase involved in cell wall biosynthesis [Geodermatophilus sabuli]SNX96677.1 Glycosyltransferase involved in cell wall bisynthesis [Geodermatophilus sabuli]
MTTPTDAAGDGHPGPLRVTHVIHSLGPGGAENVLVELAAAAPAAGIQLQVVGLSPVERPVHAGSLRALGVPVVQLDLPRWDPRAVPATMAAVRTFRPHLLHTHLKHADLVGATAGALLRLPVVSTLHVVEDAPAGALARYKRTAGLVVRRRTAARTIALSARQREWYEELTGTGRGLVVLPNGVADPGVADAAERAAMRKELGAVDGRPLIVSASLMRPEKGHALLLDAVAQLPAEVRPVVALAGDGELRGALEARVDADPFLRDRVCFLGYRDDVPALLAAADLVLHTSLADALPTTLMQALAVGVPVVATRVGGIPDIIGADAGLLVATDGAEIARAVARLLHDDALRQRMGHAGRARFLASFEATGWAARLRHLYTEVLDESARSRRRR